MHIEKNVFDNVIGTLLIIQGKSKDGLNIRKDMVNMGMRTELGYIAYVFLQRTFEIPDDRKRYILSLTGKRYRGWKAFLTNTYLKDKDGNFLEEAPGRPKKYEIFIGEKDWAEFVNQRDEAFRKRSATNSARASKHAYPYKKGRMGYARLEDKLVSK